MIVDFINSNVAAVSVAALIIVYAARLLSKSGPPLLVGLLPAWCDVTIWSRWGWPGTVGQLAVTAVLAGGPVLLVGLDDGALTLAEWTSSLEAVGLALGILQAAKQLSPARAAAKKAAKLAAGALVLMLLGGCASWQDTAQTGLDVSEAICANQLLRSPERERLLAAGFAPAEVVALFDQACAVLAATKPGIDQLLEQAKLQRSTPDRVLASEARARGLLP